MNDCDFVFTGGAEVSSTTFNKVEVSLVCPKEKNVEIHVYKKPATELEGELCTYTVPPFTDKKENEFHNEGSGSTNDVTLTTTVTEIPVIREGGLLCGAANTTATYTGNTTIKASEDKGGTISNGTVSGLEEGAQVSLTVSK